MPTAKELREAWMRFEGTPKRGVVDFDHAEALRDASIAIFRAARDSPAELLRFAVWRLHRSGVPWGELTRPADEEARRVNRVLRGEEGDD